jgi:hypothetical protein
LWRRQLQQIERRQPVFGLSFEIERALRRLFGFAPRSHTRRFGFHQRGFAHVGDTIGGACRRRHIVDQCGARLNNGRPPCHCLSDLRRGDAQANGARADRSTKKLPIRDRATHPPTHGPCSRQKGKHGDRRASGERHAGSDRDEPCQQQRPDRTAGACGDRPARQWWNRRHRRAEQNHRQQKREAL